MTTTIPPITAPEGRTESSNARRFCALHAGRVQYVPTWGKWLTWTGQRWKVDSGCDVPALAKSVSAQVWADVAMAYPDANPRDRLDLLNFGRTTSSARGIANLLTLAQSESGIPLDHEQLDRDPWLLNVQNGTIDLRTQQLHPHDPADLITKIAPAVHDPDANCPRFSLFLREIFADDEQLVRFVRRLLGYFLTGSVREHVMPLYHGRGRNGKSVLLGTTLALLGGDYAIEADASLILANGHEQHPTALADLHGKRLVAVIEADAGRRLNEALVKHITGGDRIRARRMREDYWEFDPTHKPVLLTNHLPAVRGTDDAIWSRLPLVPFNVSFLGREDRTLAETLKGELPGILNFALLGCAEWQTEGLGIPPVVAEATAGYRAEQDVLAEFLNECCAKDQYAVTPAGELYSAYLAYCEQAGEKRPFTSTMFGRLLTERGFEKADGPKKIRLRKGLRLIDQI